MLKSSKKILMSHVLSAIFFAPVESGLFGFSFGIGQPGEELGIALPW